VETVSWDEAREFCRRLSAMPAERASGRVYRLPTEAEWEYACRAGTTTRWYSGDDEAGLADAAWFRKNSGGIAHPVGQKKPNAWGLYDMHGNVFQRCADWFGPDYYAHSPIDDPPGPSASAGCVVRGGCTSGYARNCRSAARSSGGFGAGDRDNRLGFRVVADIVGTAAPTATGTAPIPNPARLSSPQAQSPIPSPAIPPPAVAPFDAAKAKEHQEAWAKHLGVRGEQSNSIGMKLALIPPGEFMMGSTPEEVEKALAEGKNNSSDKRYLGRVPTEAPRHRVTITKPFYLGMYPVTQGEYEKVMSAAQPRA
jgi:formylglycine-generating enzyme required for sulfatase activity